MERRGKLGPEEHESRQTAKAGATRPISSKKQDWSTWSKALSKSNVTGTCRRWQHAGVANCGLR